MMEERYQELKIAERGAIVSIVAYLALSVAKLFIGNLAGSAALRADGLNNTTDIIASIAVLIGLRLARRPADDDHPYGHWKAETVASMVTSFIMLAVGLEVLYSAITKLIEGESVAPDPIAGYTAIASTFVMIAVYIYNRNLAKKIKSGALMAAAKDNLSDAWTSIGAAIAIFGSAFGMPWLDGLTAVIVALLILKTAIEIFRESAFSLSDGFNEEKLEEYKQAVLAIKGIESVRTIKARNYGANTFVDVVIWTAPEMTVKHSHEITEEVEAMLLEQFNVFDTKVHVEPSDIHLPE
ncbi:MULTISPECIES: cation diffusion facilitator family transporter [Carnobacterium]|uniref:Cation transporter n=1 Tax=Carnobacterium divergens TaxID=2748 RepID=A0A5F0N1T3_CARDV|nr:MULTISPECIES: cation diffusion facilitator family transporter [Carnobacterium]MCO6017980.1 cation diffusion facilitator family transporter [Carnobacterium divergens]MDV8933934.1 cation diffusion facilitator family transporter [Carnobacterium sp.]MPQ21149.1 cation transporter [Carnobacterium divergens]TFI62010.1 cation transporter [Carnobacterium divergens]TFI72268.1 cation transporter [Carnobacterium divergens]